MGKTSLNLFCPHRRRTFCLGMYGKRGKSCFGAFLIDQIYHLSCKSILSAVISRLVCIWCTWFFFTAANVVSRISWFPVFKGIVIPSLPNIRTEVISVSSLPAIRTEIISISPLPNIRTKVISVSFLPNVRTEVISASFLPVV